MSNVTAVTNHFSTANEGFITTVGGTVAPAATVVSLTSTAGLINGTIFVGIIEPGATNQQVFTGIVDTSGSQITGVKWTRGTNTTHVAGVTVVDYVSGTGHNMMTKGILAFANQDATLKQSAVLTALGISGQTPPDYTVLPNLPNTITYNGNRSYTVVTNGVDQTSTLSVGSKLRFTRAVNAPTQCASLNGTSQYFVDTSVNGMTFTDDFVVSAWVKLTNYPSANATILSRYNGTSGWTFRINTVGQVFLFGINGAPANNSSVNSYQSLPLNKWVHVTAQLDMSAFTATSTTSYIMFDGADVPAQVSRGGTNPTALVQAGNLEVGTGNTTEFWPGKIAQAAVFNAKVTQTTMQTYYSQGLVGTEPSLISAYSFNNTLNDLNTTNANNLAVGGGSATATNADSPFGLDDNNVPSAIVTFGIITSKVFSTNTTLTIQVPEGCTIPTTGGITAVAYSGQRTPYAFPSSKNRWTLQTLLHGPLATGVAGVGIVTPANFKITIPVGEWTRGHVTSGYQSSTVGGTRRIIFGMIDAATTSQSLSPLAQYAESQTSTTFLAFAGSGVDPFYRVLTPTVNSIYGYLVSTTGTETFTLAERTECIMYAELAYI